MVSVFDLPNLYGMKIMETPYLKPGRTYVVGDEIITSPGAYAEVAEALKHNADALITKAMLETPTFTMEKPKMKTIDWTKPLEYVLNPDIPVKDSGHFNLHGRRVVFTMNGDKIIGAFYVNSDGTATNASTGQRFRNKVTKYTRFDIIGVDGAPNWGPGYNSDGLLRIRDYGPKTRAEAELQQRSCSKNWRDGTIVEMTWEE